MAPVRPRVVLEGADFGVIMWSARGEGNKAKGGNVSVLVCTRFDGDDLGKRQMALGIPHLALDLNRQTDIKDEPCPLFRFPFIFGVTEAVSARQNPASFVNADGTTGIVFRKD